MSCCFSVAREAAEIFADGGLYSEIERVGDDGVPDADLVKERKAAVEESEVVEVEVMSGIEADAESPGLFGSACPDKQRFKG